MKIESWNDEEIRFSDGSTITYDHEPDCCEYNYADFSVLEVFYDGREFDDYCVKTCDDGFLLVLRDWWGEKSVFIPCYSAQNGYYSSDVDIYVNNKGRYVFHAFGKLVDG